MAHLNTVSGAHYAGLDKTSRSRSVLFLAAIAMTCLNALSACDAKKDAAPAAAAPKTAAPIVTPAATIDPVANLENANDTKKLFADPSITKHPAKGLVYGNGQTLSIEYDGSKSKPNESVFFDLTMIRPDGIVVQIGSDTFDGRTPDRVFTKSNKVFNSDADGKFGFVEIGIAQESGLDASGKIMGKNVKIGRFPIKYETAK